MPAFSDVSKARLLTCHHDLIVVMNHAIVHGPDFTIMCGHRTVSEQQNLFGQVRTEPGPKVTNVDGINDIGKHNHSPSQAVDIAPYPIDWNNGAKIINMSFGKAYSPEKYWVDSAVAYAEQKDVLLVHSAGNENYNLDSINVFPNANLAAYKKQASSFITVGASSDTLITDASIAADFSNYGKQNVDLFAPGVKIYSTLPGGNVYGNQDGTSMAAPVVSGVAAMLRSYYPGLSAKQVKTILEKSVYVPAASAPCLLPGNNSISTSFSTLSKTGGIVNAYNAVALANSMGNK